MIDMDPQASLSGWFRLRKPETPILIRPLPAGLRATINKLRESGMGLVVIDTPPAITEAIRDTVREADLVAIPVKPSPHDMRAIGATVEIVRSVGRRMAFVVNQATARAKLTTMLAVALSQHGPVADPVIHHRVDYPTSMIEGGTVMELFPASKSASEISALWSYLQTKLQEQK